MFSKQIWLLELAHKRSCLITEWSLAPFFYFLGPPNFEVGLYRRVGVLEISPHL